MEVEWSHCIWIGSEYNNLLVNSHRIVNEVILNNCVYWIKNWPFNMWLSEENPFLW